ncbi:MAG: hypothetical protein ACREXR_00195 [Gammaproteobacteria bacterium]
MTSRTVSFQGTQLSAGQRRQLAFQQRVRATTPTRSLLDEIDAIDRRTDWEAVRFWNLVSDFKRYGCPEIQQFGTACVAEWMGY